MTAPSHIPPHLIEVKVTDLHQLFNSMDPSPFRERDLDHDAENFIVSWAREAHHKTPLQIRVHFSKPQPDPTSLQATLKESFHHYFGHQAEMTLRELKQLLREGRASLIIGLLFLASCSLLAKFVLSFGAPWSGIVAEGLTIGGWVAMWKPLDIYLYRWWPLLGLKRLYTKLSHAPVEVRSPE